MKNENSNRISLSVHTLKSAKDEWKYDEYLVKLTDNPYYKKELFSKKTNENLYYFILEKNKTLLVMMPFILRKIVLDQVDMGYFDVTSPYGFSGPIFRKNMSAIAIAKFWKYVDIWYKENKVVTEFIRFNVENNWIGYNGQLSPTLTNVCGRILPKEEQWTNFKTKVRNNYRKALKANLKSTIYHKNINLDTIKQFYEIYIKTMNRRLAFSEYFYDLSYFVNLIAKNPKNTAIVIIKKEKLPISTELLLLSEDKVYSFLGGTDAAYFSTRPNDFLKIETLKWARKKGYKYYFLGGGRIDGDDLYKYKKAFFPLDIDTIFYTGRKILNEKVYEILNAKNPYCIGCTFFNYFPLYRCKQAC